MGSVLRNHLAAVSNRRRKKRESGLWKNSKRSFKKRIMKVFQRSPDRFFVSSKIRRIIRAKPEQLAQVTNDIVALVGEFKLVRRADSSGGGYGLAAHWFPLDDFKEFIVQYLESGRKLDAHEFWRVMYKHFPLFTFMRGIEFNIARFIETMAINGEISRTKDVRGVWYYHLSPDQFFMRQLARSSSNG